MKNTRQNRRFKACELKEIILAALGIGLVLGGSIVLTPNFPIILGMIVKLVQEVKGESISKPKLQRVLKRLEKRQLISIDGRGDKVKVYILDKGREKVLKYSIKKLLDYKNKDKKWNGKWYVVMFDVPERERKKRNYLRYFLYNIGFYQYQQSVYVYPYECKEEIKLIKNIVEGGKYISYLVADRLENEDKVLSYFHAAVQK